MSRKMSRLLLCIFFVGFVESAPTCQQINNMSLSIASVLATTISSGNIVSKRIPVAVRLGFHDCVGGCNGCINFNNPDNNGLSETFSLLKELWSTGGFESMVSFADFFALAAVVGLKCGAQISATHGGPSDCPAPCFNELKWGRKTLDDCSNDNVVLPSPKMTADQMFQYFETEFGFSKYQVVALMGSHSMGTASIENSGYQGAWTGSTVKGFNNLFYSTMVDSSLTWKNRKPSNSTTKWQWNGQFSNGSQAAFNLNTDFEILYNLTLDSDSKTTCNLSPLCGIDNSCKTTDCQKYSTFDQAYGYTKNCSLFTTDFVSVFTQMLAHKSSDQTDLETTTCDCL